MGLELNIDLAEVDRTSDISEYIKDVFVKSLKNNSVSPSMPTEGGRSLLCIVAKKHDYQNDNSGNIGVRRQRQDK